MKEGKTTSELIDENKLGVAKGDLVEEVVELNFKCETT